MGRKRAPEHDYICLRCGCACDEFGTRHLGGGSRDFVACKKAPMPVLRSAHEAEVKGIVGSLRDRIGAPSMTDDAS